MRTIFYITEWGIGSVGGWGGNESVGGANDIGFVGGVEGVGSAGGVEEIGSVGGVEGIGSRRGGGVGGEDKDKFNKRPTIIPVSATENANLKENPGPFLLLLRFFNMSCKSEENRIISSITGLPLE